MQTAGEAAIYEAYKPGTEPGHNRNLGLQHVPDEDESPIASTGGMEADDGKLTFGPGGVTGPPDGEDDASGRVRAGQLTE